VFPNIFRSSGCVTWLTSCDTSCSMSTALLEAVKDSRNILKNLKFLEVIHFIHNMNQENRPLHLKTTLRRFNWCILEHQMVLLVTVSVSPTETFIFFPMVYKNWAMDPEHGLNMCLLWSHELYSHNL